MVSTVTSCREKSDKRVRSSTPAARVFMTSNINRKASQITWTEDMYYAAGFPLTGPHTARAVMVERRDGPDGVDTLKLDREWTICGVQRRFVTTLRAVRPGRSELDWDYYEGHTISISYVAGKTNKSLQNIAVNELETPALTGEIIIARRSADWRRFLDMHKVDGIRVEAPALAIGRRLQRLENITTREVPVQDSRFPFATG
ncbi:hypothetical protein DICSQDRAFT_130538 [Dichomitus squalens LYAD-421 SS1]|uniref:Uncharacterized protein n=2 Tax=Dichomitus squalens TaxID=114155 RepID=A0A4Q9M3A6_9APHY|nr:uncharacterized protein DICSQDRAFT_130538 [Dichomitus squalens LYAD-421 SS1]EJF55619.1 hypothetical protein DICSQDRAFT_130538 [Dichomitus squalens LYAD-421 SS1]TBU21310.1 hypothetical protein BD311DRAFT_678681 [Dichomitus squalens]